MGKRGRQSKTGLNMTELASKVGITKEYLQNIVSGGQKCSVKTALRIQAESGGVIKVVDFMPEAKEMAIRILSGT